MSKKGSDSTESPEESLFQVHEFSFHFWELVSFTELTACNLRVFLCAAVCSDRPLVSGEDSGGGGVRRCCRVPRCPHCRPTILRRSWPLRGYLSDEAGPVWRNTTRRGFRFYLQSVMTSWFHRLKGSHLRFSLLELKFWKLCRVVAWIGMKPCLLSFSGAESACREKV